jgi:hypothetical protein
MALAIPIHQKALHDASAAAKKPNSQWGVGLTPIFRTARTNAEEPVIPSPQVFDSLMYSTADDRDMPRLGECAAHLELLEAFHTLRGKVRNSNDLETAFGIRPYTHISYTTHYNRYNCPIKCETKHKDPNYPAKRKQKWPLFLGLAAARFTVWLQKADLAIKAPSLGSSISATAETSEYFPPPLGTC